MAYRDDARVVAKNTSWTFWRFLPIFVIFVVVSSGLGFATKSLGLWGGTVVERKVFEASYQRSESLNSRIAMDEANLAEIQRQLGNPNLDDNTRYNLNAQAASARVRIATARGQQ